MTLLSSLRRIQQGTYGGTGLDSAEVIAIGQTKGFDYYSTLDSMPFTGETGRKAYLASNNRLYIRNNNGWYNAQTVNLSVTIDSVGGYDSAPDVDTYSGTADSFNITIFATDSDDNPAIFTYDHTLSAGVDSGDVVITHDSAKSNIFNVAMNADSASANSFSITFTVSDGVNIDTVTKDFNVIYAPPPPVPDELVTFSTYHIWTEPSNAPAGSRPTIEFDQSQNWGHVEALHQALDSAITNGASYTYADGNYPNPVYLTLWDSGTNGSATECVYVAMLTENVIQFGSFTYNNTVGLNGASRSTVPVDDGTGTFYAGQHYHNYSGSSVNPESALTVDSNLVTIRFNTGTSRYVTNGTSNTFNPGTGNQTFYARVGTAGNGASDQATAPDFQVVRLYAETANTSNLIWEASVLI